MTKKKAKKKGSKGKQKGTGITGKWRPSAQQMEVVRLMVDMDQHLNMTEICARVGIGRTTLYRWMDNPDFCRYMNNLLDLETDANVVYAFRTLTRQMKRGDTTAAVKYLEIKGRFTPKVKHTVGGEEDSPIKHVIEIVTGMPEPAPKPIRLPVDGLGDVALLTKSAPVKAGSVTLEGLDDEDL